MTVVYTGPDMAGEQARRKGNRERALEALQAAGPRGITNIELVQIAGLRAGGRVQELRDRGHVITCDHERDGIYRYTLHVGTPERVQLVEVEQARPGCLF